MKSMEIFFVKNPRIIIRNDDGSEKVFDVRYFMDRTVIDVSPEEIEVAANHNIAEAVRAIESSPMINETEKPRLIAEAKTIEMQMRERQFVRVRLEQEKKTMRAIDELKGLLNKIEETVCQHPYISHE
jgi:hypothetical protein